MRGHSFSSATPGLHDDQLSLRLSVSLIAFLLARTVVATFGTTYVFQDSDTLWHIRTGEWILEHLSVPAVDLYSHSAYGQPWIANDWLADVIFAAAYKIGNWRAVLELTALSVGAIAGINCFYLTRTLRFSVAIGLTTLTVLFISPHYLARPIIFSYAILSVWLVILVDRCDYQHSSTRPPYALIPLMIIWANIHGSFTFGLMLLYIFSGYVCYDHFTYRRFAALRQELLFVIAVSASALITPYGVQSMLITPKVFEMKFAIQYIQEWRSPDFQERRGLLVYLTALLAAIIALGIRPRGPRLPVFTLLIYLGLSHLRALIMFFLLVPILFARPAAHTVPYLRSQNMEADDPVLHFLRKRKGTVLIASLMVTVLCSVASWRMTDPRPPQSITPQAAIDYIRKSNINGNAFNSYGFGGFLIFSGIPTFIDGRAQPFGDPFMYRHFRATNVADLDDVFRLLDEYKIEWAILRPVEAIAKAMARSRDWENVYSDEHAVVFLRRVQSPEIIPR